MSVAPRYDPPFDILQVVDWISKAPGDPTGAFVLNIQGALFCFGVPATRGCNGLPVIQNKHASRLDFPTPAEIVAHPGANVVIILDDGTRSVRAPT